MEKQTHTFGLRPGHTTEIVNQIKVYLEEHPANLVCGSVTPTFFSSEWTWSYKAVSRVFSL